MVTYRLLALCLLASAPLLGAGAARRSGEEQSSARRFELMERQLSTLEAEIATLNERIATQQDIIESLRREQLAAAKDRAGEQAVEALVSSHQGTMRGVATDIDKLRTHANSSATQISDYGKRLEKLESYAKAQGDNIDQVKAAMHSIIEALKAEGGSSTEGTGIYRVAPGDSLSVIAQKNKTTVKELSELNKLKNNVIFPGQKLRLPARLPVLKNE